MHSVHGLIPKINMQQSLGASDEVFCNGSFFAMFSASILLNGQVQIRFWHKGLESCKEIAKQFDKRLQYPFSCIILKQKNFSGTALF